MAGGNVPYFPLSRPNKSLTKLKFNNEFQDFTGVLDLNCTKRRIGQFSFFDWLSMLKI